MNISKEGFGRWVKKFWQSLGAGLRKVLFALPFILIVAGVVILVLAGVRMSQIKTDQTTQIAATQWAADSGKGFMQLTCFGRGQPQASGAPALILDGTVSLSISDIVALRKSLDDAIKASDSAAQGKNKDNNQSDSSSDDQNQTEDVPVRRWVDAYSTEAGYAITKEATDQFAEVTSQARITGVAGDYMLFHPLMMISGSFVSDDDLYPQRIVLDEGLSWQLFGSYDIVGREVKIQGIPYTIAGVVRTSEQKISSMTYGAEPRAYVLFNELARISQVNQGGAGSGELGSGTDDAGGSNNREQPDASNLAVICYEMVLPEPLDGIALQNFTLALTTAGKDDKNFLIVENTNRFSFLGLYNKVFPIGQGTLQRTQYTFPFWEISAQVAESTLIFWWVMFALGLVTIIPAGLAVRATIRRKRNN